MATTAQREGRITRTEVSRFASRPANSIAPNGSSRGVDYWTAIVYRESWTDDPRNGVYAGRHYRVTERYISNSPHYLGQFTGSESRPWDGE